MQLNKYYSGVALLGVLGVALSEVLYFCFYEIAYQVGEWQDPIRFSLARGMASETQCMLNFNFI